MDDKYDYAAEHARELRERAEAKGKTFDPTSFKTYLVQVTVSIEVNTDDRDDAAEYAESLLVDDGYTIDDVTQPRVWNEKSNSWEEEEDE